jgi:hypothetical protein
MAEGSRPISANERLLWRKQTMKNTLLSERTAANSTDKLQMRMAEYSATSTGNY